MPQGYKICPGCKAEVAGPRTKECPKCGAAFGFKLATPTGEPVIHTNSEGQEMRTVFSYPEGYENLDKPMLRIHIPAGECPVQLRCGEDETFPSDDTLLQWAGNVRQAMINKGVYIRNTGLIYWARKQMGRFGTFAPRSDEMRYVGLVVGGLPDITTREVPV